MNGEQIHTSESQLRIRCADLEKDNARLRGAIEEVESMLTGPTSGSVAARACLKLRKALEQK